MTLKNHTISPQRLGAIRFESGSGAELCLGSVGKLGKHSPQPSKIRSDGIKGSGAMVPQQRDTLGVATILDGGSAKPYKAGHAAGSPHSNVIMAIRCKLRLVVSDITLLINTERLTTRSGECLESARQCDQLVVAMLLWEFNRKLPLG